MRAVTGVLGSMTVLRAAREAKLDSIKTFSRAARDVKLDSIKNFARCARGKVR